MKGLASSLANDHKCIGRKTGQHALASRPATDGSLAAVPEAQSLAWP